MSASAHIRVRKCAWNAGMKYPTWRHSNPRPLTIATSDTILTHCLERTDQSADNPFAEASSSH